MAPSRRSRCGTSRDDVGPDAAQQTRALVAKRGELHRHALGFKAAQAPQHQPHDVGVQAAAQALVGGNRHHANRFRVGPFDDERVLVLGVGVHQVRGNVVHLGRVRAAGAHALLRFAHL